MVKKEKTPSEQQKSLKRWGRACFFGEFVSVASPFVAIALINYDTYFIEYDGTKISIGFFLAMAVMGLAIWLVSKKKIANSMITLVVGWGAAVGILFLIQELLRDLCWITFFGWLGLIGALGLDIVKDKCNTKAEKIQKAIERAEEENTVEAYKKEQQEKAEKKKVRF